MSFTAYEFNISFVKDRLLSFLQKVTQSEFKAINVGGCIHIHNACTVFILFSDVITAG